MRKKIITCAVCAAMFSMCPVQAQKVDLSEINLNDPVVSISNDNVLISSEKPVMNEDASPLQRSLEDASDRTPDEDNGFIKIFNLKGGVTKTNPDGTPMTKGQIEKTVVKDWMDGNYATGKWFGARPILEDHGLSVNSSLLYSPFMKTGGGDYGEASGKGYSLFNLSVSLDTEKANMWKGGTFYALYQRKAGYGISGPNGDAGAMGDWMGLDGWDWRQINQISEYWYQQKLFDDKLRMKFGKQDANCDFGFLNSGWDFINTAFSVNPTTPMPTYPDQSFGFMAEINPKEWLSIRDGVYSRFNVPFNITEIEVKPKIKELPGRYMIGAWELSDSNGMGVADGVNEDGSTYYNNFNRNYGAYVGFEQMVYKENKKDENDMQGLIVFGQFGISPSNRNDISKYIGGGLEYIGLIPKRDEDKIGIAVANGSFARRLGYVGYDDVGREGSETVLEAFYRFHLNRWIYFQPDVQFISNPGGCYANSVAIGLRSVITF